MRLETFLPGLQQLPPGIQELATQQLAMKADALLRMDGERLAKRSSGSLWDILGPNGELREEALDHEDLLEYLAITAGFGLGARARA